MKFCETCGEFFEGPAFERCPNDGTELKVIHTREHDLAERLVGETVDGRFRVARLLGSGGMGAVYQAVQTSVTRDVALKVMLSEATADLARRFILEARTTSSLRNVHTVTIFDFGQSPEGMLYLAMELLEGRDLEAELRAERALDWPTALHVVAQVAESLEEAHGQRIIHRDLKPGNVFLTRMGDDEHFVKVLDFGIAKLQTATTTNLTGTGMIVGTPAYMSPEQARGEAIDERADLYSLGVILFEMLAGRPPFLCDQPISLLMMHCQEPVPTVARFNPEVELPPEVEALLYALLEKRPDQRLGTAAEVRRHARDLLAGTPLAVPMRTPSRPRPAVVLGPQGAVTAIQDVETRGTEAVPESNRPFWSRPAFLAAAAALVLALVAGVVGLSAGGGEDQTVAAVPIDRAAPAASALAGASAPAAGPEAAPPTTPPEPAPAVAPLEPAPEAPPAAADLPAEPTPTDDAPAASDAPPAAEMAPPVAAAAPRVVIHTRPVDGVVVLGPGGEELGATPLELDSPAADTRLTLKHPGYHARRVDLAAGATGTVEFSLHPARTTRPRKKVVAPPGLLDP